MTVAAIRASVLIESLEEESDEQFVATVHELLRHAHAEWATFSVGSSFRWRGSQYREFVCVAGSASCQITSAATKGQLSRAILLRGSSVAGEPVCSEIRGGVQTSFDPNELQMA